jgi:hypothetical protein
VEFDEEEEKQQVEHLMQSFDLMKLGKPNTRIIQNLCFM